MAELRMSAKLFISAVETLRNNTMPNLVRLVIGGSEHVNGGMKTGEILKNDAVLPALSLFKDQLKELKITGLEFGGFPGHFVDGFGRLESIVLQNLHITKSLEFQTFVNLPALYHFRMTLSKIQQRHPYGIWSTFIKGAPNLRVVDMSRNNLASIEFLLEKNNGDSATELTEINLSHNRLSNLHLKNINIFSLRLNSNPQLYYMGDYKNTYIQKLDISNCSIEKFPKEAKFYRFDNNQAGLPPAKYDKLSQLINLSQNPIEKAFPPNVFTNFRQLKYLDLTGIKKIPCDCTLTVPLTTVPNVIVWGTCLNEQTNARTSIEKIRKTTIQLITTTTCDVCPARPCLHDQTCSHDCASWNGATCRERQTNCKCEKSFTGVICEKITTPPTTTTTTTTLSKTTISNKENTTISLPTTSALKNMTNASKVTTTASKKSSTTLTATTTTDATSIDVVFFFEKHR